MKNKQIIFINPKSQENQDKANQLGKGDIVGIYDDDNQHTYYRIIDCVSDCENNNGFLVHVVGWFYKFHVSDCMRK